MWRPAAGVAAAFVAAASLIPTLTPSTAEFDRGIDRYPTPTTRPGAEALEEMLSEPVSSGREDPPPAAPAPSLTAAPGALAVELTVPPSTDTGNSTTASPASTTPSAPTTNTSETTTTAAKKPSTTTTTTAVTTTTTTPPAPAQVPAGDVDGLLRGRLGFGRKATGGAGGSSCVVTSLADSGAGSLRACAESAEAAWIQFAVSGEIRLGSEIEIASNKTIDGRGAKITIRGELELTGVNNVVIHNIRVTGSPDDAIQIKGGSSNIWLDHLDLSNSKDGLVDITQGSTNVTVSWTRFSNQEKVMLLGNDGDPSNTPHVTIHHCFFDGTGSRHPRLRYGKVHMFNNYLRAWYQYGVASSANGQTLSEANIYQAGSDPRAIITHMGDDPQEGMVRSTGDLALNGAIITQRSPESVFTPPYGYRLDPANNSLANTIAANAGTR